MKKRSEFVALNASPHAIFRRGFIFVYQMKESSTLNEPQSSEQPVVRVGFTASKKVGNAVCRASAKRRLRAVVDTLVRLNPDFSCSPCSFVLIARKAVLTCDAEKMEKDLSTALQEMGANV